MSKCCALSSRLTVNVSSRGSSHSIALVLFLLINPLILQTKDSLRLADPAEYAVFRTSQYSWISLCAGYSGYGTRYTPNRAPYVDSQGPYYRAEPSAPPQHPYTAGLSEQEQYEAAIRASMQNQGEGGLRVNHYNNNTNDRRNASSDLTLNTCPD